MFLLGFLGGCVSRGVATDWPLVWGTRRREGLAQPCKGHWIYVYNSSVKRRCVEVPSVGYSWPNKEGKSLYATERRDLLLYSLWRKCRISFSQFSKYRKFSENKQFPFAVTAHCVSCFLYSEVHRYEYQYSRISEISCIPVPKCLVVMLPVYSLVFTLLLRSTSIPNSFTIYTSLRFLQIDINTGIITFRL
jgi:hypothetical protein